MISTHEKIAELAREVRMRRRVYPRLVVQGEMTPDEAERHIAVMEAIIEDYMQEFKTEEAVT